MNQPAIRKKLGVGDRRWESCNNDVCHTPLPLHFSVPHNHLSLLASYRSTLPLPQRTLNTHTCSICLSFSRVFLYSSTTATTILLLTFMVKLKCLLSWSGQASKALPKQVCYLCPFLPRHSTSLFHYQFVSSFSPLIQEHFLTSHFNECREHNLDGRQQGCWLCQDLSKLDLLGTPRAPLFMVYNFEELSSNNNKEMEKNQLLLWAFANSFVGLQVVNDAGHMVPYNQPKNAFDMLSRFLTGKPF